LDTAPAYFFERNQAGRGLDFDKFPKSKADFMRYAVQLNFINPVRDIIKCPLPPLEEIARGATLQIRDVIARGTQSRKDLDTALNATGTVYDWFSDNPDDFELNLDMNKYLGAEEAMSPGRVQNPEGAKTIVLSYKTTAGVVATVVKHRFLLTCYTEEHTGRLRLDATLTSGKLREHNKEKKKLIYDAIPHA